jgi:hypothetical protein
MEVELEMYIGEKDESKVMKKVSDLAIYAKELGFELGEIEIKNKRHHGGKHHDKNHQDKGLYHDD